MSGSQEIIIPRPGTEPNTPTSPIPGPSEEHFTSTFGNLLPPAQYLKTSNGQIAYYTFSPTSSAKTTTTTTTSPSRVLFLHGVQTPSLGLLPLATSLHTSFPSAEFVLLDLYGHGLSATPLLPHTPSLFHELIDQVLDHLKWPSCHLLGYSFGGVTGMGYISSSPSRAAKVISISLVAPAGLWKPEDLDVGKFESKDYAVVKSYILELLEGGGPLIVPSDSASRIANGEIVAEKIREWQMVNHKGHTASVIAIVRDAGVLARPEVYEKAVATGLPIIAVLGETDDVVFEKDLMEVGVGNVYVVEGAGHAVVREKVPEVAAHIERFWKGIFAAQ
ncbi:alpha/beta-hydrolase [Aureobasidium pullulans]|uniref:Alpha/beta-hydrolase n=1 Tax=Aureobasidium pullulans TaxID=5580 RepID=A0A4V4KIS1_AURPU|nr:alpha/beta-hydrolase [Aureobasidium pullulans]